MFFLLVTLAFWDHSYTTSVTFTYDDNLFAYSDEYINDFIEQIRAYRFPFSTYDDLYTEPRLDARIRNRFFKDRTTTLNFSILVRHHAINKQKDFQRLIIGLRQSFGFWALKGSYRVIPTYLIRYYNDPVGQDTEYTACEVAYHNISGKLSLDVKKNIQIDFLYSYSIDNYVEVFDLYDAHGHEFCIDALSTCIKRLNMKIGYCFKTNTLTTDTSIPFNDVREIPDGSYNQHSISPKLTYRGFAGVPIVFEFGYTYTFRNYRSTDENDLLHFGRQQNTHALSFSTVTRIKTGMNLHIEYARTMRHADSEVFPQISSIKDYCRNRVSAGLQFYF